TYTSNNSYPVCSTSLSQAVSIKVAEVEPIAIEKAPSSFKLDVYPNPTSGPVTFKFQVAEDAKVTLDITSMSGAHIATIFDADVAAEETKTVIFYESLPPGVYLYYMRWNDRIITGKFIKKR
ncbi:MAG TPA: T9SS type A sorting domain-containing protein, partial [Bacteroidales bacterium]